MKLHGFFALSDSDFVSVLLKDLHTVGSVLITIGLGINLGIVALEVPLVVDLALLDEADINVGARAQIVVHSSLDRLDNEGLSLLLRHILPVIRLKNGHSSEGT